MEKPNVGMRSDESLAEYVVIPENILLKVVRDIKDAEIQVAWDVFSASRDEALARREAKSDCDKSSREFWIEIRSAVDILTATLAAIDKEFEDE